MSDVPGEQADEPFFSAGSARPNLFCSPCLRS